MKKTPFILKSLMFLLMISYCQTGMAQDNKSQEPAWIKMMEDPNVNFREAVATFEKYWKNKEKPVEESEIFETQNSKTRENKEQEAILYGFEYKKFKHWKRENAPYVKADGTLLSQQERLAIWEKERKNRQIKN